jgi:hypothetical protein
VLACAAVVLAPSLTEADGWADDMTELRVDPVVGRYGWRSGCDRGFVNYLGGSVSLRHRTREGFTVRTTAGVSGRGDDDWSLTPTVSASALLGFDFWHAALEIGIGIIAGSFTTDTRSHGGWGAPSGPAPDGRWQVAGIVAAHVRFGSPDHFQVRIGFADVAPAQVGTLSLELVADGLGDLEVAIGGRFFPELAWPSLVGSATTSVSVWARVAGTVGDVTLGATLALGVLEEVTPQAQLTAAYAF